MAPTPWSIDVLPMSQRNYKNNGLYDGNSDTWRKLTGSMYKVSKKYADC